MRLKTNALRATWAAALAFTLVPQAMAQEPSPGRAVAAPHAEIVLTRQAVQGVSADALAILSALQRDPALARQLAARPEAAQQLLAARGATRAESITVTPGGGTEDAAKITITITITIRDVTIKIVIKI